jgi:hypothetical protein
MRFPGRTWTALLLALVSIDAATAAYLVHLRREGPQGWLVGGRCIDGRVVPALHGAPVYIAVHQHGFTLDRFGLAAAPSSVPANARMVLLVDQPDSILESITLPSRAFVLATNLTAARRRLGIPPRLDRWLYLDGHGRILVSGDLSTEDVRTALGSRLPSTGVEATTALEKAVMTADGSGGFSREHDIAGRNGTGRLAVLFVNYACSGCQIADVVRGFDHAAIRRAGNSLIEVPASWDESDREILTVNLGVKTRVESAPAQFSHEWDALADRYGILRTNGFSVLFRTGHGLIFTGSGAGVLALPRGAKGAAQ